MTGTSAGVAEAAAPMGKKVGWIVGTGVGVALAGRMGTIDGRGSGRMTGTSVAAGDALDALSAPWAAIER